MKYAGIFLACLFGLVIGSGIYSCRKPYSPPAIAASNNYLVVEGQINNGPDSTIIKLSRSAKVSSKVSQRPEMNASVAVESDQNVSYPLTEIRPGTYAIAGLGLDKTHKYRLSIKTANGGRYASNFMPVLDSPPIDSVSFDTNGSALTGDGLNIYVATHDPTGIVRYFRWDYQETWEFHSAFESNYIANGDTVLPRDMVNDEIYSCWRSDTASSIYLASTAGLSQSTVVNNPVNFINSASEKLSVEYSIQVRQYALTSDAYQFYSVLKKNTELRGSIFDSQPTEIPGNIYSVSNPAERVIGYIGVGSIATKRIFIHRDQLPYWVPVTFYTTDNCQILNDPQNPQMPCCFFVTYDRYGNRINQVKRYITVPSGYQYWIPIKAHTDQFGNITGYTIAEPECADCRLRGTNVRPAFWR
ncbi:MAG TPA: DUF4249 domain-containing protein [Mucilaginibacter sp.]|nr:DUF4249 domain-containing protein [Mucilaginibacter sp.]